MHKHLNILKMDNRKIKLSEAISQLLSTDNRDKSLGEIGEDLSDYLIQIKDMVENGEITYSGLTEEISKYFGDGENPKPGTVSQLLLGCVDGEGICALTEKASDVSFFYDQEQGRFVSIDEKDSPSNRDTCAVLYMNGDPREVDLHSFKEIGEKGFEKVKIRHKDVSESIYKEINISNLKKYIKRLTPRPETTYDEKINTFMSVCFLVLVLCIIYFVRNQNSKKN